MKLSKKIALPGSLAAFLAILSQNTLAQISTNDFAPLMNILNVVFVSLPQSYALIYIKFWLWVLVYGILLAASRSLQIFKDDAGKKYGKIIALAISLLGVGLMPNSTVVAAGNSLSFLFALIFILLIPIILWLLTSPQEGKQANPTVRAIVFIVAGLVILTLTPTFLSSFNAPWGTSLKRYMQTGGAVMLLVGIVQFVMNGLGNAATGVQAAAGTDAAHTGANAIRHLMPWTRTPEETEADNELANQVTIARREIEMFIGQVDAFARDIAGQIARVPGGIILPPQRPHIVAQGRALTAEATRLNTLLGSIEGTSRFRASRLFTSGRNPTRDEFNDANARFTLATTDLRNAIIDYYRHT